jgi:hypothetical protein
MLRAAALALPLAAAAAAQGPVRVHDTAGLRAALAAARPGATILLAPGDYDGFGASDVHGRDGAPIVVRAAEPARAPRFRGGIHLADCTHLELGGFVVEGAPANGVNIDDGGTAATPAHHVVLRGITVRDCGGDANHDGIKLSGVDDFELVDCVVERWGRRGSGVDMVGCRRGRLEGCTFRDRADRPAANGVQMKGGTRDVVVRRCRFEDAGERAVQLGGSTGRAFFRPAVEGFEAKDLVVEGCTIVGGTAAVAFVGCDGAVVRHNTIVAPRKWVLRILQETTAADFVPCRGGVFTDNLVVHACATVANVGGGTAPDTFPFARNWWFRSDDAARSRPQLPVAETDGAGGKAPRFVDEARGDFRQASDSPARAHGADALPAASRAR